ncbi:BQ5605_C013g07195 [Microbotryum silenes-dioicae]|uniref:BQ5605_C013g07195 protein n=1 Tax=Microbotryum silenes-dioicae TaxID=796604 RepID=A0A2X0LRD6_9BASI|nr:BQ5605_C013g07195 [Microbotryum silenes-dioicae]
MLSAAARPALRAMRTPLASVQRQQMRSLHVDNVVGNVSTYTQPPSRRLPFVINTTTPGAVAEQIGRHHLDPSSIQQSAHSSYNHSFHTTGYKSGPGLAIKMIAFCGLGFATPFLAASYQIHKASA